MSYLHSSWNIKLKITTSFDPSLNVLCQIMTDAEEMTEWAMQAADAHITTHDI